MGQRDKRMGEPGERSQEKKTHMEFPGDAVVRTQCLYCWDPIVMPGQGTKIPHAMWHGQNI